MKPVVSNQPCQSADSTPDNVPTSSRMQIIPGNNTQSESHNIQEVSSMEGGGFFLPDLNMIPAEDCWIHVSIRRKTLLQDIELSRSHMKSRSRPIQSNIRRLRPVQFVSLDHKERDWQCDENFETWDFLLCCCFEILSGSIPHWNSFQNCRIKHVWFFVGKKKS